MDLVREDLPRVSVETLQDWKFVKAHYGRAALASLDATIVASGLPRDRDALLFHMNKFIENALAIAQPNLRVNGRNFEEVDDNEEEMESFDESLDRHIWSLSDQRLQWDRKITDKRRNAPMQIEKIFQDYLSRQQKDDIEEMQTLCEGRMSTWDSKTDASNGAAEMEVVFEKTSGLVQELTQSIPAQQERSKTIKIVEAEVKNLKG